MKNPPMIGPLVCQRPILAFIIAEGALVPAEFLFVWMYAAVLTEDIQILERKTHDDSPFSPGDGREAGIVFRMTVDADRLGSFHCSLSDSASRKSVLVKES
jgi:hypothetical protein